MEPAAAHAPRSRALVLRIGSLLAAFAFMAAVLFLAAGRTDWPDAWVFLTAYFLIAAAGQIWLAKIDPALAEERLRWGKNTKAWDRWIVAANGLLTVVLLLAIGLDAGRFGWSDVPCPVRLLALLGIMPAFGLPLLASRANTFLASTVRIQEERGHVVISDGPYARIRHPMYAGMILFDLCVPLVLGSWAGVAVGVVMTALIIARTAREDRTLHAELPGYREYAERVRFRLIPGVW